ncbi:MAG: DNA polymerase III subunit [Candidatus Wildermuthbacteria bacterium]|nr:DNA polymerase III subunit [Candidatus Wildermuthbacteria bacterium]
MEKSSLQEQYVYRLARNNALAHAYLFLGNDTEKKKEVALRIFQMLACVHHDKEKRPCHDCIPCKAIAGDRFPDVLHVQPEEGKEISVGSIRKIATCVSFAPYASSFKGVLIEEADKMNKTAQSAFLKILEEPPGNALFILFSAYPNLLLETIRSRVQMIPFYQFSPLALASQRTGSEIPRVFSKLEQSLLKDRFSFAAEIAESQVQSLAFLQDMLGYLRVVLFEEVKSRGEILRIRRLFSLATLVQEAIRYIKYTNVSVRLALEQVMIEL